MDVAAEVVKVTDKIESCSRQNIELHVKQVWVVFRLDPPAAPADMGTRQGAFTEDDEEPRPRHPGHEGWTTGCWFHRTPANQAIFRLEGRRMRTFRGDLAAAGRRDPHPQDSSALLASEGGAQRCSRCPISQGSAFLAQSPSSTSWMAIAETLTRYPEQRSLPG